MLELILIAAAGAAGVAGFGALFGSKRKRTKTLHLADARGDTQAQLTAMSDLILDLEPQVSIANDSDLKERFTEAARTYSDVRETAERARTGHEVADLRIEIAKARWQLDVIDAEINEKPIPPEPHTRDSTGSAWDSTRGTGA